MIGPKVGDAASDNAVGVPLMRPFVVLNANPLGNAGLIAYDSVPPPPVPTTGVKAVNVVLIVNDFAPLGRSGPVLATTAAAFTTVISKEAEAVAPSLSVTVTVYDVLTLAVGVPVIAPVVVLSDNPETRPGLIEYVV